MVRIIRPDFALILYAHALKMVLFGALVIRVLISGLLLTTFGALGVSLLGLVAGLVAPGWSSRHGMARMTACRTSVAASVLAAFGLILLLR
jgi:hypothetical protein